MFQNSDFRMDYTLVVRFLPLNLLNLFSGEIHEQPSKGPAKQ